MKQKGDIQISAIIVLIIMVLVILYLAGYIKF